MAKSDQQQDFIGAEASREVKSPHEIQYIHGVKPEDAIDNIRCLTVEEHRALERPYKIDK